MAPPGGDGSIASYLASYRRFSEDFTATLKLVLTETLTSAACGRIREMADGLKLKINP